jgi:hypothetical protein
MSLESEIYELARSGQAYLACERGLVHVRRLKRQDDTSGAMIFLMHLAHILGDTGHWDAALTSARRSIDLFPPTAKTIPIVLKDLFLGFAGRVPPEGAGPDFFTFSHRLMTIFPAHSKPLIAREGYLANASGQFSRAERRYLQFCAMWPSDAGPAECPELAAYAAMIWRWIAAIEESEREAQSQFVLCRATLALTNTSAEGPAIAGRFFELVQGFCPVEMQQLLELPLVHFTRFFLKAVIAKHDQTIGFLLEKYGEALANDMDIVTIAGRIRNTVRPTGGSTGWDFGAMFQSLMGGGGPTE